MMTDIEIAQSTPLCPIAEIAAKAGIPATAAEPYGSNKAKITEDFLRQREGKPQGKLILVTAVNPTPAGEGKTTTSIGLAQALCRLGKNAIVTLREPSLGPVFGLKGGAAGGGYSQVPWRTSTCTLPAISTPSPPPITSFPPSSITTSIRAMPCGSIRNASCSAAAWI